MFGHGFVDLFIDNTSTSPEQTFARADPSERHAALNRCQESSPIFNTRRPSYPGNCVYPSLQNEKSGAFPKFGNVAVSCQDI